jgi:hypothetical protein
MSNLWQTARHETTTKNANSCCTHVCVRLTVDATVASQQTTVPLAPSVQPLAHVRDGVGGGIDAQHPRGALRDGIDLAIDGADGAAVVLPLHPNDGRLVLAGIRHGRDGERRDLVGVRVDLEDGIGMARQAVHHAVAGTFDAAEPLVLAGKGRADETELVGLRVEDQDLGEVARDEVQVSPLAGALSSEELILAVQEGRVDQRYRRGRGNFCAAAVAAHIWVVAITGEYADTLHYVACKSIFAGFSLWKNERCVRRRGGGAAWGSATERPSALGSA